MLPAGHTVSRSGYHGNPPTFFGANGLSGQPGFDSFNHVNAGSGADGTSGSIGADGQSGANASPIFAGLQPGPSPQTAILTLDGQVEEIVLPLTLNAIGGNGSSGTPGGNGGHGGKGGDANLFLIEPEKIECTFILTATGHWETVESPSPPSNADVGYQAPSGSESQVGYQAPQGNVGYQAPSGSESQVGHQAPQGNTGYQAPSGTGSQVGYQAPQGNVGYQAPSGTGSQVGYQAPQGNVGYQAPNNQSQVGYQAPGYQAPANQTTTELVRKSPPSHPGRTKPKTDYLDFRTWDGSSVHAAVNLLDGTSFHLTYHGSTITGDKLAIVDWQNQQRYVWIDSRKSERFVISQPVPRDNQTWKTADSFQYQDDHGIFCEVKLKKKVIAEVMGCAAGGNGGNGGNGAPGGAGGNAGNGADITVSSISPLLMLQVYTNCQAGLPGSAGPSGIGGQGGAGGSGKPNGAPGRSGASAPPSPNGLPGAPGRVTFVRTDEAGNVLQQGTRPCLETIIAPSVLPLNGSKVLEPGEAAKIILPVINTGDISFPPNAMLELSSQTNMSFQSSNQFLLSSDWINPQQRVDTEFSIRLGQPNQQLSVMSRTFIDNITVGNATHNLGQVSFPIACKEAIKSDVCEVGQSITIGTEILNFSGLTSGSIHNRPIRIELELEEGLNFVAGGVVNSADRKFSFDIPEITDSLTWTAQVMFDPLIALYTSKNWKLSLFWRDYVVQTHQFNVKLVPSSDLSKAHEADVLLLLTNKFTAKAHHRLVSLVNSFGLKEFTWDYTSQNEFPPNGLFRGKLIIFCAPTSYDKRSVGTLPPDFIKSHFFNAEVKDQDSSLLAFFETAPSADMSYQLWERVYDSIESDTNAKFFGKPDQSDLDPLVAEIETKVGANYPDYLLTSKTRFNPVEKNSGMRSEWNLGTVSVYRSSLSFFNRFYYVVSKEFTTDQMSPANLENMEVAIRHSLTIGQKLRLLAPSEQAPNKLQDTEAALYYDLKGEFFYAPRPLMFLNQMVDLILGSLDKFAHAGLIEAVLRVHIRLLQASYWKSFGTSPLKPKYYQVEASMKKIKETLKTWSDTQPQARKLDIKALDKAAKTGAKASDRVKWRTFGLPSRVFQIPEKDPIGTKRQRYNIEEKPSTAFLVESSVSTQASSSNAQ